MADLVERQEVKDIFTELYGISAIGSVFGKYEWKDICETTANKLPSIQPERKKGTWTKDASCPFCGFKPWYERDIHTLSFCPNCGANMRGEQE